MVVCVCLRHPFVDRHQVLYNGVHIRLMFEAHDTPDRLRQLGFRGWSCGVVAPVRLWKRGGYDEAVGE